MTIEGFSQPQQSRLGVTFPANPKFYSDLEIVLEKTSVDQT